MNKYEIDKHPEINGGAKKVVREHTHTEYNTDTGELTRVIAQDAYVGKEPDYVKIYTDCMLVFNNINPSLSPFIIAFSRWMTYANFSQEEYRCTVQTNEIVRRDVANYVGVSDRRVKQAIKELVDAEIFIPLAIDGQKKRGIYFVNPWVVGKGEWKDIRQLRGQFEFISGAKSVVAIESSGERKVIMPLTQKPDGQLEMKIEKYREGEE